MHLHHHNEYDASGGDGFVFRVAALRPVDGIAPDVITGPSRIVGGRGGAGGPAWISESPAGPTAGQRPLFPESGTLPPWTKVVTGLSLGGLLYGMDHWANPMLKASTPHRTGGLWNIVNWTVAAAERLIKPKQNYVAHHVSKGYAHTAHGPAYTIGLGALRWEQSIWNVAYLADTIAYAVGRIVHTIIPREITKVTAPMKVHIRQTRTDTKKNGREIITIRRYVTTTITKKLAPRITRIERTVTHVLPSRINKVQVNVNKVQVKQQQDRHLIIKLLPLLTITGAVTIFLKALPRLGLNWLKCQNNKDFGNEMCASPPGTGRNGARLLKNLLSLAAGAVLLTNLCAWVGQVIALAAPIIDGMVKVLAVAGAALCDGKHSAAPPLPLETHALPPVTAGLPI